MNKLFELIAEDGMKHIIVSAALTAVLGLLLPKVVAAVIVFIIGGCKEMYDKSTGKGQLQTKDIICNIIGIVIGAL